MSIIFCAIDPSITCTGLSTLRRCDDGKFDLIDKTSISTKTTRFATRWDKKLAMHFMFCKWLKPRIDDISFCVFENYSYGSPGQLADLGELNGLYRKYLSDNGKPVDVIAPASVKKIVGGHGRASKSEVASGVLTFLNDSELIKFSNRDESDSVAVGVAYAISMMALAEAEEVNNEQKQD